MTNPELRLTRLIESVDFHEFLFQYSLGMAHKYSFPEYFYNIAAGLEYEFGEIKAKIGVDEALNKLCSVYEDTQKKAHLRVFMRMNVYSSDADTQFQRLWPIHAGDSDHPFQ